MLLFRITLRAGRSPAQLQELAEALSETAAQTIGVPAETVRVVYQEVPPTHWFVGGQPLPARMDDRDAPTQ